MELSDDTLERARALLGHTFADPSLLAEALTHASAAPDHLTNNERMEFLGDAVLDLVVCQKLYTDHPESREGDLTKLKSAIVSRRTCTAVARRTGLADLLIVGKGIMGRQSIPASLAANVYESVVAALHLDGGYEVAKRYVLETLTPEIEKVVDGEHAHNYKALLQHHAQQRYERTPNYELLDEQGPDHSKCFEICVTLNGDRYDGAWGPNKKAAEQKAAVKALLAMGVFDDDQADEAVAIIDAMAPQEL